MARLLCDGLGAREVYDSIEKNFSVSHEKFFVLGDVWLVAMQGEPLPERTYNHVAFHVNADDLPIYTSRLRGLGLEIQPSRARVTGEGESIYFFDFDNHLFELHTGTLNERLRRYASPKSEQS